MIGSAHDRRTHAARIADRKDQPSEVDGPVHSSRLLSLSRRSRVIYTIGAAAPQPLMAPHGAFTFTSSVPYEAERIYAAAVYCSDGRVGDQIDEFLHKGLGFPRYDRVACPGGPVVLASRFQAFWDSRGVEEQVRFLTQVHDVRTVVLIAHEGCAYYARRLAIAAEHVEAEQKADLHAATRTVHRLASSVDVLRFIARRVEHRLAFEPV
jgi:hypothetical protein